LSDGIAAGGHKDKIDTDARVSSTLVATWKPSTAYCSGASSPVLFRRKGFKTS